MAAKKPKKKVPKAPKKPAKPATKKETRETPGAGHNISALREEGVPFVERFLALKASQESDMASYNSDYGKLYAAAAGTLGISEEVLKAELNRIFKNKKAAQKEAEMEAHKREQTELFRASMVDTQFEMFAAGELAPAAEPEGEAAKTEDEEAEEEGAE